MDGCTESFVTLRCDELGENVGLMDTPGLNDANLPLDVWLRKFEHEMSKTVSVSLVVLVMRAKTRPDVSDKATTAILFECFNKIDVSNFVVIFNRAHKRFDE